MDIPPRPAEPRPADPRVLAADALRRLARDERAKALVERDPVLRGAFGGVARRYTAGDTLEGALAAARSAAARGHAVTVDFMGENTRDPAEAARAADEFVRLVRALRAAGLNASVSLDLTHVGLAIDPDLAHEHAARIARAAAEVGTEMIVSMEGSDRTDAILAAHARLCETFSNVGVTLQARLHRTPRDLGAVLERPGRVRLVKGAYDEPASVALPRGGAELQEAYRRFARTLLASGRPCSIATHDPALLDDLHAFVDTEGLRGRPHEFEMLLGLAPERLAHLRDLGHPTREYVVYGHEWFLYVCNRLAEEPDRIFLAVADALEPR